MFDLIPVPRVETIDRQSFVENWKNPGRPVVIEQLTAAWPAREKWSVDYMKQVVGDHIVPLYDSDRAYGRKHQHAAATEMRLDEYMDLLQAGENNLRMFFYNLMAHAPELTGDICWPDIGLKLFKKLPVLFVGGAGAKVQMHIDIDLADILLSHFGGKKRVLLFPPEQTRWMYRVPFSFSSLADIDYDNPDFEQFPALQKLSGQITELNHGDVLYIPSGWWHYIVYEELGFSLAMRAFPMTPAPALKMLNNLLVVRNTDAVMRKLRGDQWVLRNEKLAVTRTHERLAISE
ncbi:MAG: cupin-like domain-containing protein [Gammaproteobacteria bacterium]|nr:MAG: cupin-like domain-containing protein [Gammaproteobacteria bacterium]